MKLQLGEINAENFGSWKKLQFDFSQPGTTLIVGKTGSGKSTIFKALTWAAYGSIPENVQVDEIVNESVGKNTKVAWSFKRGKHLYTVTRYRKHDEWKNKVNFEENGNVFGEKDTPVKSIDEIIERTVGGDLNWFLKTIFFIQRDTNVFPSLTDGQQKELLESITDLRILPDAEAEARAKFGEFTKLADLFKERYTQQLKARDVARRSNVQHRVTVEHQRANYESLLKGYKEKLKLAYIEQKAFKADLKTAQDVKKQLVEVVMVEHAAKVEKFNQLIAELKNKEKWLTKVKPDSVCDQCGQIMTEVAVKSYAEKIETNLEVYKNGLQEAKSNQKNTEKEIDNLNISQLEKGLIENTKRVEKLKAAIALRESDLKELDNKKNVPTDQENAQYALTGQIFTTRWLKKSYENLADLYSIWSEGFGKRGIRAILLPSLLENFSNRINDFLQVFEELGIQTHYSLGEDGRIQQRYSRFGAPNRSYGTYSGGQRQAIAVCTNLALAELSVSMRANVFDAMILDEPFDGLDTDLIEKVPSLLQKLKKENLFVISHDNALVPYFDRVIKVAHTNGTSRFIT